MQHELFRHIELEVFVQKSKLESAMWFVRQTLRIAAGTDNAIDESFREQLVSSGLEQELHEVSGICAELDGCLNDFLRKEGYGSEGLRLHRTGHGFGLGNHEAPWIAEGSVDRLAENMVISIEPGIYLEGIGGVRHSDTVLVTKDGFQLLTQAPMDLDSLVIRQWKPITRSRGWMVRRALRLKDKASLKR